MTRNALIACAVMTVLGIGGGTASGQTNEVEQLPPTDGGDFQASPFGDPGPLSGCSGTYEVDPTSPPADIDGDGAVGFGDLVAVLSAWGVCQPAFELTGQQRMVHTHNFMCSEDYPDPPPCTCSDHTITAIGLGRFDRSIESAWFNSSSAVASVVRDDRLELEGWVEGGYEYGGGHSWGGSGDAEVRFVFSVHAPTGFAFTASTLGVPGAQIVLSGPGGFELVDPVDTSGILAPGEYELDAVAAVSSDPGVRADFDYALDFAAGRCAADLDRDGVVGFTDLLLTLDAWGPGPWPGACCRTDGVCVMVDDGGSLCVLSGGTYQGAGTACAYVTCVQRGACCLPDGSCEQSNVGGNACAAQDGVYHGDDTLCADVSCPPAGACCLPDGSCAVLWGDACTNSDGVYHGDDTPCADVVCIQPGACCLPNGACVQSAVGGDDFAMQGGIYYGDDTLCADTTCPTGACCLPDFGCFVALETGCDAAGGSFMGEGTVCDMDCANGACCLPDGTCFFVELAICDILAGDYQGNGVPCESITCP